jgi:multidrug efflux pump subunit AcrB
VQGPTQGQISVSLTPRTDRDRSIWRIEEEVRRRLARIPVLHSYTVRETGNTAKPSTSAPVVIRVTGEDPLFLDRLGAQILPVAESVDGVVEPTRVWRADHPRIRIEVDELRAAELGLSPLRVSKLLLQGSRGLEAGEYHGLEGSPVPVQVRYREEVRRGPEELLQSPFFDPQTARPVPLASVATAQPEVGRGVVTRDNLAPSLEITAMVEGRPLSEVTSELAASLDSVERPRGYEIELVGENEDMMEARREIGAALAMALAAVYLLLVAQFRSFVHPFTVLTTVPLSLSGVAAALWIAEKPVSMPVMVGLVLLVGIVVNNAIILIDFIRQRRERGMDRKEAVIASVSTRFRPILMTAVSTIVGMVPLAAEWALGAERFSPLAIAVIGGLATATFLTLIVIPVLYDVLDETGRRLASLLERGPS